MVDRDMLIRGAKIELARREFFFYCHLKAPDFYKEDRQYLIDTHKNLLDKLAGTNMEELYQAINDSYFYWRGVYKDQ